MNKAPQRPYTEYRMPPRRRPPKKTNHFKTLIAFLISLIVILSVVLAVIIVSGNSQPEDDTGDSTTLSAHTDEKDDAVVSPSTVPSPETTPAPPNSSVLPRHILIDAGHGFSDPGCTSEYMNGFHEKDITIAVANYLKAELKKKGYTVSMTHDGKTFTSAPKLLSSLNSLGIEYKPDKIFDDNVYSAYERTMYANILHRSNPVGVFLSLHVNSNEDSASLSDFTIDYCGENSYTELSGKLTDSVCDALNEFFPQRKQRKYVDSWDESFIVTKYSEMPSFLLEMGYATTPSDASELLSTEWQQKFAGALAQGIDDYYKGN